MSLVLRLPRENDIFQDPVQMSHVPAIVFGNATNLHMVWLRLLTSRPQSLAPATRNDIWTSKSGSEHVVFCHILTSKCASRHNGVHFFDISNFQKWSGAVCVLYILTWKCVSCHNGVHFFDILNFQKWSGDVVLCAFWLGNVLRATTACNFSSLIWPAGSAPADLASLLFDPLEPQIVGKHCVSRLSFLLHLCFSSVHIVGSWTSKLPSNGYHWLWPTPEAKKWYSPILLEEWWITSICIERLRGKPKNFGLPTSELVRLLPVGGFTESFLDVFSMHDFWIWPVVEFAQQKPPAPVDPMFPHWDLVRGLEHELYFSIQLGIS